ncbi:MAG: NADH-quinone oxidoreductase subunit J [Brachymonas sp.]|nr:NADH-quinone oxidoreductase subunit J [Brachymonas sp.]
MNHIETVLFYAFAAVLLLAAFRVITSRNTVHAVMYLVLTFFQAAAIWLLLKAEFLAVVLVLVYVGAVLVLFLFVLMMINFDPQAARDGFWKHFPLAAGIGLLFMAELAGVFLLSYSGITQALPMRGADGANLPAATANTNALGQVLYTHYLYPVQIAAVLLLVAIIAAIALTLRSRKDSKRQSVGWQVNVKVKDRMRVLKMDPTRPAPAAEEAEAHKEDAS